MSNTALSRTVLALAFVACWGTASAVSVSVTGTTDTDDSTLYSNATSDNGGATDRGRVGRTGSFGERRMLVRFDLSGIPTNSVVSSATLQMLMAEAPPTGPNPTTQSIHRVTASWVEGNGTGTGAAGTIVNGAVSWDSREHGSVLWATPGGDFDALPSAQVSAGNVTFVYELWDGVGVTSDVQSWISNPGINHGWIVVGDESQAQTARGYGSSESIDPDERPVLFIEYSPPAKVEDWPAFN